MNVHNSSLANMRKQTAPSAGPDLVDHETATLSDLLRRRASETPHLELYTFLEDGETRELPMTASDLERAARRIGQTLSKFVPPGSRVILLFEDGVDYIAGLFGCLAAGMVAVSGIHPSAPRGGDRLLGIARDSRAAAVIGHARVIADFQRALGSELDDLELRWVAAGQVPKELPDFWTPVPSCNQDLALIQYTSGSTRDPRGVMLSHRNLLHNMRGQALRFGYRPGCTGVTWLPFSHDMGLIGAVLMALYAGARCVILSPSHFLEDPGRWLRAISRYRAVVSGAPSFAFDLCAQRLKPDDIAGLDLSCWRVAGNGAEPVRAGALRRFAALTAPAGFKPETMYPTYGLAEATLMVTGGAAHSPPRIRVFEKANYHRDIAVPLDGQDDGAGIELVGCGSPMDDQSLAIVDPKTGARLDQGRIGEIWVAGPSVSAGYYGREAENAAIFGGELGDGCGPYLRTGDLGFMLDGELYVTGRLRDLIIMRGKNYYPQDLEIAAEAAHPAIRSNSSAAFLQDGTCDLVIICELERGQPSGLTAVCASIREAVIRDHGINPARIVLTPWGTVPKTPSGKIQRAQTRTAYAGGKLAVLHESAVAAGVAEGAGDQPGAADWFALAMREAGFDIAALDPATRLTDLGFDSLKVVELKAALESATGITISIASLYELQDLSGLSAYLREALDRDASGTDAVAADRPTISTPAKSERLSADRASRASRLRAARLASDSHGLD